MKSRPVPSVAILTPSLNQFEYLKACIASVELQGYPNVEQIVIDGGSEDGTAEYLAGHPGRVSYWQSRPDRGQGHALNQALERATAEWIGWQNADDYYLPEALWLFAEMTERFPEARVVVGDTVVVDPHQRRLFAVGVAPVPARQWLAGFWPYNQGVFIHRSIVEEVGPIDESLRLHMDTDLFARIARMDPAVAYVDEVVGAFRKHEAGKTSAGELDPESLGERAELERRYNRRLWPRSRWQRAAFRARLHGIRLARFGPGSFVRRLSERMSRPRSPWVYFPAGPAPR